MLLAVMVAALLYDVAEAHRKKKRKFKWEHIMEHATHDNHIEHAMPDNHFERAMPHHRIEHAMPHNRIEHAMPHYYMEQPMPHNKGLLALVSRHKNVSSLVTSKVYM